MRDYAAAERGQPSGMAVSRMEVDGPEWAADVLSRVTADEIRFYNHGTLAKHIATLVKAFRERTNASPAPVRLVPRQAGESSAVSSVIAERDRQKQQEGWSEAHDDTHADGSLARAAACYALPEKVREYRPTGAMSRIIGLLWPFDEEWWKPTPEDRRRELVKAGALILAEIDRLDRRAALEAAQHE